MIFEAIDTVPLMTKPTIKLTAPKQKQSQLTNSFNKQTKKSCIWFLLYFELFYKMQIIDVLKLLA